MKKTLVSWVMGMVAWTGVHAAVTPLWMRDVQISPDGSQIAFCYKGDIYKVNAKGGEAVRLTTQDSYEATPVWSPDGQRIAFASDRFGSMDLFVMSADGGTPVRLTTVSGNETPSAFTPDGKYVLFSANLQDPAESALFPASCLPELYRVPAGGGRIEQVLGTPAEMVCYAPSGSFFLYQDKKGMEDEWRKHHTSSVTRDIWQYDAQTGRHTNLTRRAGEDRNPVLSPDGKSVYFLSERDNGSFNVYTFPMDQPQQVKAVTRFTTHPVRFLSMSTQGTLCYTYDGEIYTQRPDGQPAKLAVSLTRDDLAQPTAFSFTKGATEAVPSPDGKQVAFIVRGDVFVTSVEYATTKQVTRTPVTEKDLTFSSDNRTLAYASQREGKWRLYTATIVRKEDPNFANATLIDERPLLPGHPYDCFCPQFSPDGKQLAFIEDRGRLMVLDLQTQAVRQVTDGSTWYSRAGGFDYSWSPDGKWFTLAFIGNKHDPYSDIGLVAADGQSPIVNLTNSGYTSSSPRWVMKGNAILFSSERYGMRNHASWGSMEDAFLVFLNQDAYDKYRLSKEDYELQKELEKEQKKAVEAKDAKKTKDGAKKKEADGEQEKAVERIVVETEGICDRIVRLTPNSSDLGDCYVTDDGETLYYLSAFEGGYDLWKKDLRKGDTKLLHKLDAGRLSLSADAKGKQLFLLGGSKMQKMEMGADKLAAITYNAQMQMDLAQERAALFEHVYQEEGARFYNLNMHGVDWDAMSAAYRKFLPHINNNYDFAELLSEWLGELNVSHTGGRYYADNKGEATAALGLLFDWQYQGDGLRIAEVIEKGPFDHHNTRVGKGVILEKIDGTPLQAGTDYIPLLNGKAGRKLLVSLYDSQTGQHWDEVVKPISTGAQNSLLYKRWVKQREADVERWSGGRLGYVHIQSMSDASFRDVYSAILGKYNHCDGIVIDTRFNGGGRLHEDIEILFSGQKYLTQVVRGHEACDMPSRRWNKPSIMVQCEANYSNAHGTPWVYHFKQMGKLVGAPVPGTMTTVNWVRMQDSSLVFGIPVTGYRRADGGYLENSQLDPDIYVLNAPETVVKGEDTQLRTAVETLLKDLGTK